MAHDNARRMGLGNLFTVRRAVSALTALGLIGCAEPDMAETVGHNTEAATEGTISFATDTLCATGLIETRRLQITNVGSTEGIYGLFDWYGYTGSGGDGYSIQ